MHYCLSKEELNEVVNHKLLEKKICDHPLELILEKAENWEISFGCLTYFFSMILEKKINSSEKIGNLIEDFFLLENSLYALIQEFDYTFIDHLIRNMREKELSLEDELIRLQTTFSEYNYDQTLRF